MHHKKYNFVEKVRYLFTSILTVYGMMYLVIPLLMRMKEPFKDTSPSRQTHFSSDVPTIFIITPTYARLEQKADLTRLSQTLQLVPRIHWIIVEDSANKTVLVTQFLQKVRFPHTHLFIKSISKLDWKQYTGFSSRPMHRGVQQRNLALDWIRKNVNNSHVVYFADDDNTYDVLIFEEMRYTIKVSVWPVGLVGEAKYSSPSVKNGTVVGWIDAYKPNRPFALDMAGFAVNGDLLKKTNVCFNLTAKPGTLETGFLSSLKIRMDELEPKADNCTQILVWHTKTKETSLKRDEKRKNISDILSSMELEV